MGVGVENAGGDFLHEATHQFENHQAGGDDDEHCENITGGKEDEFEEIANEGDGEGGSHDADDGDEEAGAEFVERPRDPVDEDEVDSEGDENGNSGELGVREALEMGDNREGSHAERNGDANWEGIGEDVFGEIIFDTVGVVLEGKDKAREADTSEVKKRHFDRGEGVLHREKNEDHGQDRGIDSLGEKEGGGTLEVVDRLAALGDDARDGGEIGI